MNALILLNRLSQSLLRRESRHGSRPLSLNSLNGTTLEVYRYLVTKRRPAGPREVMRSLSLSGPSVSAFHLQKLERLGLVQKDEATGLYAMDHVYLKHFVLLRSHLVPRYLFYAMLSTLSIFGWFAVLPLSGGSSLGVSTQAGAFALIYGIILSIIFTIILWRETLIVMRKERI